MLIIEGNSIYGYKADLASKSQYLSVLNCHGLKEAKKELLALEI